MQPQKPLVIYHGGCRDGFAAAWCVWRKQPHAEFVAAQFSGAIPDVTNRVVYIVDFSYSVEVLNAMADKATSILILDHHKTAQAALESFKRGNVGIVFDMNRSGAGITWDHFFTDQERPWLIDYVEDRDLWRFALPESSAIGAYMSTLRYDFETWYKASFLKLYDIIPLGRIVEDKTRQYVREVSQNARRITFCGYDVPIVNAPQVDISELVGYLGNGETFSMGWFQRSDGKFSYSLRSRGDFDVSELAKRYGGGGHKNAAGFTLDKMLES